MVMEFVLNEKKAQTLGYTVDACYDVIDRIFAEYGIKPEKQGFYRGPNKQHIYDACITTSNRLLTSSWFLNVVEEWYWRVKSDDINAREDCLASYYRVQKMNLI